MKQFVTSTPIVRFGTTIPAGSTVYQYTGYDYGLAKDDTQITGWQHMSVTLNRDGSTPFFTIPVKDLDEQGSLVMSSMVNSLTNPPEKIKE